MKRIITIEIESDSPWLADDIETTIRRKVNQDRPHGATVKMTTETAPTTDVWSDF